MEFSRVSGKLNGTGVSGNTTDNICNNNMYSNMESMSAAFEDLKEESSLTETKDEETKQTSEEKETFEKETPTGSSSILDKIHDVVESELYGRSRAILRRNMDSVVCISEIKLKEGSKEI